MRTAMSNWETYEFEDRIKAILRDLQYGENELDHFGQPFVSSYQIAIAYAERHPEAFQALNLPIGGLGTGEHNSLAQYIARELSRRIKKHEIIDIEPAWFRRDYVNQIDFNCQNEIITASNLSALSMFRLRED